MRGRSIRHKLILVSMGATTAALLLACILLRAYDQRAFRDSEIAGLEAQASTVAAGSGAALSFDDIATATQALETLRSHANLRAAELLRLDGRPFAALRFGTFRFTAVLGAPVAAGAEARRPPQGRPGPERVGTPLRVLLVEDNVVNQRVAVGLLTRAGHHVTLASNGLDPRPLPSRRSA